MNICIHIYIYISILLCSFRLSSAVFAVTYRQRVPSAESVSTLFHVLILGGTTNTTNTNNTTNHSDNNDNNDNNY